MKQIKFNKIKQILIITILTISILSSVQVIADENTVELSASDIEVPSGGSGWCWLNVSNMVDVGLVSVNVSWDPLVVSVVDVVYNDGVWDDFKGAGPGLVPLLDVVGGFLSFDVFDFVGVSGDGWLARLLFEPVAGVADGVCCDVVFDEWSVVDMSYDVVSSVVFSGSVCVVDPGSSSDPPSGGGGSGGGTISDGNELPVVSAVVSPLTVGVGEVVSFDASDSYDPDGDILSFSWDFGDGSSGTGVMVDHVFDAEGVYDVVLRVGDGVGFSSEVLSVTVVEQIANNPPSDPLVSGMSVGSVKVEYVFSVVSSDLDGDLVRYDVKWGDGVVEDSGFVVDGVSVDLSHSWDMAGRFVVEVRAFDNKTFSSWVSHVVLIDAVLVGDLGVLVDVDGDGVFDVFRGVSSGVESLVNVSGDGVYVVDVDGDGDWDYTFDEIKNIVVQNENIDEIASKGLDANLLLIAGILVLLCIIIVKNKKSPCVFLWAELT